jgi:hypothetical protein
MKKFQCSYVCGDGPAAMEIWAKDAQGAVCAAIEQLRSSDYHRMEVADAHGLIFFRQGPSRRRGAARTSFTPLPSFMTATAGAA